MLPTQRVRLKMLAQQGSVLVLLTGAVACRADEAPAPVMPPAPRLKVQSYQNYETSERGAQLAVTPHLSWQINDDLELTLGPTFYSYLSPIFHNSEEGAFSTSGRTVRSGLDRTDYGAALGYYRDFGRLNLGLSGGLLSADDPYLAARRSYATGTLSAGYRLSSRWSLFSELYHNWPLGDTALAAGPSRADDLRFSQPGQSILTLGTRYTLRENESLSLSVSAAPRQGAWLRLGAIFRF